MIKVSVMYPNSDDATFDMDYYIGSHVPMVQARLGDALKGASIAKGLAGGAPDAPASFVVLTEMTFESVEAFQGAFGPNAEEILGDLPNFTNAEPVLQISDIVV